MRFITNYRYSVKEYVTSSPIEKGAKALKDLSTDDYDKFYSQCDRTMVGFVHKEGDGSTMKEHPVQCFYGIKADAEKEDKKEDAKPKDKEEEDKESTLLMIDGSRKKQRGKRRYKANPFDEHVPSH